MDEGLYIVKSTGWEGEAIKTIMNSLPENYITSIGGKKPYIQAKAGPRNGNHKTIQIAPAEGVRLMVFFTDMKGSVREGFLPICATSERIEIRYTGNITLDIKMDYDPDF